MKPTHAIALCLSLAIGAAGAIAYSSSRPGEKLCRIVGPDMREFIVPASSIRGPCREVPAQR